MPHVDAKAMRVNVPLTTFSLERQQQGEYIADKLFGVLPVDHKTDLYYNNQTNILDIGGIDEDLRGETSPTREWGNWTAEPLPYQCRTRALKTTTPDETQKELSEFFDIRKKNVAKLLENMAIRREVRCASMAFNSANYAAANKITVDGTTIPYLDDQNGNPLKVIQSAVGKCINSGVKPNTVVIPYTVWEILKWLPRLTAPLYGVEKGVLSEKQFGEYFGIPNVLIPITQYNAVGRGKTASPQYIWDTHIWVGYVMPPEKESRTFGVTFSLKIEGSGGKAPRIRSKYDDEVGFGAWVDRAEWCIDEVMTDPTCGCLITTPLTP